MATLSRESDAQRLPIFLLVGLLDAVILSALDLISGDYIYHAFGRLFGVATPFVPFSLTLYLVGALIGLACYGLGRNSGLRRLFVGPAEWIAGVSGVSLAVFGALLLLDLLFTGVFPRFDLPALATQFIVLLTLFNGLVFSVLAAGLIYATTASIVPPGADADDLRRLSVILLIAAGLLVIAVFLVNDLRVQRAAMTAIVPKP